MLTGGSGIGMTEEARLVAQLTDGSRNERMRAAKALGEPLSCTEKSHEDRKAAIVHAGGIEPLIALVRNGCAEGKRWAAFTLSCLAEDGIESTVIKADIVRKGGIEPLAALLSTGNAWATVWSVYALNHLSRHNAESKEAIVRAGVVEPLVRLKRGDGDAQGAATLMLEQIATDNAELAAKIVHAEAAAVAEAAAAEVAGIKQLVMQLTDRRTGARMRAARSLRDLAKTNPKNQAIIARMGGIKPLVALVSGGRADAQEMAASALGYLAAGNAHNQEGIFRAGGIDPLVALVRECRMVCSAFALTQVCIKNADNQVAVGRAGGIEAMAALARKGSGRAKGVAELALELLAESPENQAAIARARGFQPVATLTATGPSLACLNCGKEPETGRVWSHCTGCVELKMPTSSYYCSAACQTANWPAHKKIHKAAKRTAKEKEAAADAAAEEARIAAEAAEAERLAAEELLRRCLRGWRAEAERAGRQRRHDKLMLEEQAAAREREAARKRRAEAERAEREANPLSNSKSKYVVPKGPTAPKAGVDRAAVRSLEAELEHATYTSEEARLQRNLHGILSQVTAASEAAEQREAKQAAALRKREAERSACIEASTHSVPAPPTLGSMMNRIVDEAMRGKEEARR